MSNIYGLFDPRQPDLIMYVGKGLEKRAQSHWKIFLGRGKAVNVLLRRWFEKLKADGAQPEHKFLEENVDDWKTAEQSWIGLMRVCDPELCNVANGGDGVPFDGCHLGGKLSSWALEKTRTVGHQRRAGRIGGHRTKELHPGLAREAGLHPKSLEALAKARTPEHQSTAGKKGGYPAQNKHADKKLLQESGRQHAQEGHHIRWHLNRGQINPECQLCRPDFFDIWEGQVA